MLVRRTLYIMVLKRREGEGRCGEGGRGERGGERI
jgi:hypothetical protein